jgi:hypothetical protein
METIRVSRFMPQRAHRWERSAYLWSEQTNKYLSDYRIEVNPNSNAPCDVLLFPHPHYPGKEFAAYSFTAPLGVDYRGELDFQTTPMILDSSADYPYLTPELLSILAMPNVRHYVHGVAYRDPAVHRRRMIGNEYHAHVYQQRLVYNTGPDIRPNRPEIAPEIWAKVAPLIRPPTRPFTDEVFEYIQKRSRPLKERSLDISFSGRVTYAKSGTYSVPTMHRRRLKRMWDSLPGKNKFFLSYDDGRGTTSDGKPIQTLKYPYEYVDKLLDTKVVISPWGFSAWCIRDLEALACGCLVIKPECSSVLLQADIYNPAANLMIWCDVQFNNLAEQLNYCYSHLPQLQERAERGKKLIFDTYYPNDKLYRSWTQSMRSLLESAVEKPAYSTFAGEFEAVYV